MWHSCSIADRVGYERIDVAALFLYTFDTIK